MEIHTLGHSQLTLFALGLGCMGMSMSYAPFPDRTQMITLIHQAVERSITFFDPAEI